MTFICDAVNLRKSRCHALEAQTFSLARSTISCATSLMMSEPPIDLANSLMDESNSRPMRLS